MSGKRDTKTITEHLEGIVDGNQRYDQQLVFDPITGDLVALGAGAPRPSPDAVTADSIAEEGFFEGYGS
jgi:hypothetical protein